MHYAQGPYLEHGITHTNHVVIYEPTYCPETNQYHPYDNLLSLYMHACIDCCTIPIVAVDIHNSQRHTTPSVSNIYIKPNDAKLYLFLACQSHYYMLRTLSLQSSSLSFTLFLFLFLSSVGNLHAMIKAKKKKNNNLIQFDIVVFFFVQKCIYTLAHCAALSFVFEAKNKLIRSTPKLILWQAAGI